MSLIKYYLSMEDNSEIMHDEDDVHVDVPEVQPVTDEQEYEAEAELAEQEDAHREHEAEVAQAAAISQEAHSHLAQIERYQDVLSHGIENQQYSPQFAAIASAAMEEYKTYFGDTVSTVGLEDYGHENLSEFYVASNEAFGDIGKKMADVAKAISAKTVRTKALIGKDRKGADALITKIDAALNGMTDIDDATVSVSLAGVKDRVALNGEIKPDLGAALREHSKSLTYVYGTFVPSALKYLESAVGGDIEKAMALKNPMESAKDVNILGGHVNKDSDGVYEVSSIKASDKGTKDMEFTKASLQKLMTELKKAVTVYQSQVVSEKDLEKVVTDVNKAAKGQKKELTKEEGEAKAFLDGVRTQADEVLDVISNTAIESQRSLFAVYQLAERAMKAMAKKGKKADKSDDKKDDE